MGAEIGAKGRKWHLPVISILLRSRTRFSIRRFCASLNTIKSSLPKLTGWFGTRSKTAQNAAKFNGASAVWSYSSSSTPGTGISLSDLIIFSPKLRPAYLNAFQPGIEILRPESARNQRAKCHLPNRTGRSPANTHASPVWNRTAGPISPRETYSPNQTLQLEWNFGSLIQIIYL